MRDPLVPTPTAPPTDPGQRAVAPGAPTAAERAALLRALLLGRAAERALAETGRRRGRASVRDDSPLLAAIAAASALEAPDRLAVPHALLAAHLGRGMAVDRLLAARRGEADGEGDPLAGLGPQSPVALAAGAALGARLSGRASAALAIVDAAWLETNLCRAALAFARERRLALVVVALEQRPQERGAAPAVERDDVEVVRSAVRGALAAARAGEDPSVVHCRPGVEPEPRPGRDAFRTRPADPVQRYQRWLLLNGFTRSSLDEIDASAATELRGAEAEWRER